MREETHYRETKFGFEYGAAEVSRLLSDPKWGVLLSIRSRRQKLEVRVTPSGLIRVGRVEKCASFNKEDAR